MQYQCKFNNKTLTLFTTLSSSGPTDFDPETVLEAINKNESTFVPTDDSRLALASLPHTQRHEYLIDKVTNDFLTALANVPNNKWGDLLQPVRYKTFGGKTSHPKILVLCGGDKSPSKIMICNKALVDWMAVMKKKSSSDGKCQWYQPSTQNQRLRTFLGSCNKRYNWRYEIGDFSFRGGLKGFMDTLYSKRFSEFGKVGYAKKDVNKRLDQSEQELIDLSKFDENDPRQHQMKFLFGCGTQFGLRGSTEHVFLEVSNMTHGSFPSNHPFSGCDWYGIEGLQDKTHKLSVHKDHVRDNENFMRTPCVNDDPTSSDFGGCIKRFLQKLSPGQTRIYCKVIPDEMRAVDSSGFTPIFYSHVPLGKNMIGELFKEGAAILGLPNHKVFSAHALRALFVTKLANGKGVSDEERMASSRHNSQAASVIYQERNSLSESNKFEALGIVPPEKKMK